MVATTSAENSQTFDSSADFSSQWTREQKAIALNLGIAAVITGYGFAQWGWGESDFAYNSEGWFGSDTDSGGADKMGHAYTGAVITAISSSLCEGWGYENNDAAFLGACSGLLATTLIEVGDGFSDEHGFSWEDQAFNVAGVGFEYLRQRFPDFGKRVQFRWEYFPTAQVRDGKEMDIFTDYEGSRWMLAFPLKGWMRERSWLDWVDVLVGYGTRDFEDRQGQLSGRGDRHPFIGIGIHIPLAKERLHIGGSNRFFEYFQIPGTAVPFPP
jgi:hypothetical protein